MAGQPTLGAVVAVAIGCILRSACASAGEGTAEPIRPAEVGTLAAYQGRTYYCPWADMVVRLRFDVKSQTVSVSGTSLPVEIGPPQLQPYGNDPAAVFTQRAGGYVYDYELHWPEKGGHLWNRRVNLTSGRVWSQRGYCISDPD
jgi:hypothetical protein